MHFRRMICLFVILSFLMSLFPAATNAVGVSLAPGTHIRWIDRIADLPEYGSRFYEWLESNAGTDGALADPSKALCVEGEYVYRLDVLSGKVSVTASASSDEVQSAVLAATNDRAQQIMDYAFDVYGAFDRDHPEIFWLSGKSYCGMSASYSHNKGTGVVSYEVTVYFYLRTADFDIRSPEFRELSAICAAVAQRDKDILRILADCPQNENPAEQVRYINKVLTQINGYNSAVKTGGALPDVAWECISALSGSYGLNGPVCEGYARGFKVLCDRLGIPCVLTEGQASNYGFATSELHMWNYVQIEGSWYAVDVTWNDPVVSGREQQALSGYESEHYLLIGLSTQVNGGKPFGETHQVTNRVTSLGICYTNGPELNDIAYRFKAPEPIPDPEPEPEPEPDPDPKPDPEPVPDPIPTPDPQPTVKPEPDPNLPGPGMTAEYLSVTPYRSGSFLAPQKEGYVFTGWFIDPDLTVPLGRDVTEGEAYAGFIRAEVLTVRCQLSQDTDDSSDLTDLRMLTGVGSLKLSAVVFVVNDNECCVAMELYERLSYGNRSAGDLFGPDACFIASAVIEDISGDHFDDKITIIPGWYTLDGTYVTGTARSLRVSDGLS